MFIVTADGYEIGMHAAVDAPLTPYAIAWSLSQINRFNGHAHRPYSVAEHSLLVCDIVEREFGLDHHAQLAALMHDAHESVATDMHSPGKDAIGVPWRNWENRWQQLVRSKFGIQVASSLHREAIHSADLIALATERRDLMAATRAPWPVLSGVDPLSRVHLNDADRKRANWEDWRDRWLDKFHELEFARDEAANNFHAGVDDADFSTTPVSEQQ